jgi:hypothetical protein
MIDQQSPIRPTMIAIGAVFLSGLMILATATVVAVVSEDGMGPAEISALAMPSGVEIVDTHALCTADACTGEGAVLASDDREPGELIAAVESRLLRSGWASVPCAQDLCMRSGDLRVDSVPWAEVDDTATAPLRSHLDNIEIDQSRLAYLRFWRCGLVEPCG